MGFWDRLLGRGGEAAEEGGEFADKTVARLHKKLMNKYVQTIERKRVIGLLADHGSEEATRALLGRFTYITDGSIVDEDEKEIVYQVVLDKGARALAPLHSFIVAETAIYWPLKAYTEIAGEDAAVRLLLEALDGITDRFAQSMERMTNIVSCFRDYRQPQVMARLLELTRDESEEIRFLAVDGLSMFDAHQEAVDAIVERLLDDEETTRVKTFIMDLLMERRWNVRKHKKALAGKLPESYFVDDTGVIQRRHG